MRFHCWILGLLAAAQPLPAHAFEGVLHMVMTMPSVSPVKTDVTIRSNGDSRTDTFIPFLNQRVSFLQRGSAPVVQMMHSTKQYTESSYLRDKAGADAASALRDISVRELPVETVAGYVCRHALLVSKTGSSIEVWITGSIQASNASLAPIGGNADLVTTLKQHGLDGFPLKLKMTEQGMPITLEAVSVESRAVDPALFSVPAGYTRVAESDMNLRDLSPGDQEVLRAFEKQLMSQMPAE